MTDSEEKSSFWLVVAVGLGFGYLLSCHLPHEIADEGFHAPQIYRFLGGDYTLIPELTTLPTYHLLIAKLTQLTTCHSLPMIRFLNLIVAFFSLPVFLRICASFNPAEERSRCLQFLFLPPLFPFFFLIYTDSWALLSVLLMIERALAFRLGQSACFALLAVALRTLNLPWLGFALALAFIHHRYPWNWHGALGFAKKLAPYYLVFSLIAVFYFVNHGFVVGDRAHHAIRFNPANFYFFLFVLGLMNVHFLPGIFQELKTLIRKTPWVIFLLPILYWLFRRTCAVTHPYNQPGLDFYLHNQLLFYSTRIPLLSIASFLVILLSLFMVFRQRRHRLPCILLLLFALTSTVPLPLIEPRYYLVPLTLFIVFQDSTSPTTKHWTLVGYAFLSGILLYGISAMRFFL